MEIIKGKITEYNEHGKLVVESDYRDTEKFIRQQLSGSDVVIGISDGRKASLEQIKKAHAILGEIADWSGALPSYIKRTMKLKFVINEQQEIGKQMFSLGSCDMTLAREFIQFLIEFVIEYEIPTRQPLQSLCDDIEQYIYMCLKYKKCAVCGKKAELHHVDRVGMGNDRTQINHLGREVLPLCGEHHVENHSMPDSKFFNKYHIQPIKIDMTLCKIWRLKYE